MRHNIDPDFGDVAVTEAYTYEGPGGRASRRDTTASTTTAFAGESFFLEQTYDNLGAVASINYPCLGASGSTACSDMDILKTVPYRYVNGALASVGSWASKISYYPSGMINTVTHGGGSASFDETITADASGLPRPSLITASAGGQTLWSTGTYQYDGAGNIKAIADAAYAYDAVSRLVSSSEQVGALRNLYQYDSFGNRLSMQASFCRHNTNGSERCFTTGGALPFSVVGTTNRYTSLTYDAAGDVVNDGHRVFTYDVPGMPQRATVGGRDFRYLYTADDERIALVERVSAGGATHNRTTWTLRGFDNKLLRIYSEEPASGISWKEEEIWRGSSLLADDSPGGVKHYVLDHLGSPRLVATAAGGVIGSRIFSAFGGGGSSDGGALQFTGQERDSANVGAYADLPDYFHARYHEAASGRFLSVDPAKDWKPAEPQSWNMYTYVRNNPVRYTDKDGRVVTISTSGNSQALQDEIVETLTRPDGRAAFAGLANDTGFTMNMKDATITPQAVIQFQMNTRGSANITFGTSTPIISTAGGKTQVTGANVQVDTTRVSAFHPDKSGVTTNVHEMHHVNAMRSGGNPGAGDLPSSQTGPAEREGQRVAAQAPDMTKQQAQQFLQNLLASDAVKLVQ